MCERGFLGFLSAHWDRSCPGNGAIQCASHSCLVLHLLPLTFCIYDSWSSSCFDVFSLNSCWKDRRECEIGAFIVWISSAKGKQSVATGRCFSCGLNPPDSLSPNTVTLSPWGRGSKHTHSITHTHSFTMCHRANYQQSGCKRSRVIQVSIPQPPLGSRIRSQKIVRDADGWQSDSRQQRTLLQWRLGWSGSDLSVIKGVFVAEIPQEAEGGESSSFLTGPAFQSDSLKKPVDVSVYASVSCFNRCLIFFACVCCLL